MKKDILIKNLIDYLTSYAYVVDSIEALRVELQYIDPDLVPYSIDTYYTHSFADALYDAVRDGEEKDWYDQLIVDIHVEYKDLFDLEFFIQLDKKIQELYENGYEPSYEEYQLKGWYRCPWRVV